MPGFRAAAWTSCGSLAVSIIIAVIGMRGIGIVGFRGQSTETKVDPEGVDGHNEAMIEHVSFSTNKINTNEFIIPLEMDSTKEKGTKVEIVAVIED